MTLDGIQDNIKAGRYRFSDYAVKRMIKRSISRQEVETVIGEGEIIEEYPDDKYSPSCLVYGKTEVGKILHIRVSLPPTVVVITAYEPDPEEWVNGRNRR
ncbi:MAG: DUF4258 domain-containing protein [Deltaproteobacteria bacterium]|jgi:hypothetical protein|nr:MAG: DUF4258 domain-containing protein [Deltaproteobacteria bacterium]